MTSLPTESLSPSSFPIPISNVINTLSLSLNLLALPGTLSTTGYYPIDHSCSAVSLLLIAYQSRWNGQGKKVTTSQLIKKSTIWHISNWRVRIERGSRQTLPRHSGGQPCPWHTKQMNKIVSGSKLLAPACKGDKPIKIGTICPAR